MSDDQEETGHITKKFKSDEETLLLDSKNIITVAYNRCRNPLRTAERFKTINLRKAPKDVVEAFNAKHQITPKLTTSDRLCYKCKCKVTEMCQSSEETTSQSHFIF